MSRLIRAVRLSIYLGNADVHRRRALSGEIAHRAHREGLAGATTMQGILGYGHSGTVHRAAGWHLSDRTPLSMVLVDTPEKIRAFLPHLDDLAGECLIVCDPVQILPPP